MPSRLTPEAAARIAALARLSLTGPELERAARELDAMLDHFDVIARVDTAAVTPANDAVPTTGSPRPDEPRPSLTPDETFASAPDAVGGLFRVPRVMGA